MYNDLMTIHEMPEVGQLSLCVYIDRDELFQLGERITERFPDAYMNGYSWSSLIWHYVRVVDPELLEEVKDDPEAGMVTAYMDHSEENLLKMRRFESHVLAMLADEPALMAFIEAHYDDIEWD